MNKETKNVTVNKVSIEAENAKVIEFLQSLKTDIFSIKTDTKQNRDIVLLQFVENASVAQRSELWVKKQRGYADMYIGRNTTLFATAEKLAYKDALQHKMSKNEIMLTFATYEEFTTFISSVYAVSTEKKTTKTKAKTTKRKETKSA